MMVARGGFRGIQRRYITRVEKAAASKRAWRQVGQHLLKRRSERVIKALLEQMPVHVYGLDSDGQDRSGHRLKAVSSLAGRLFQ